MLHFSVTNEFEEEVLYLIDNRDDFTRSDLQGMVTALVNNIMERGYQVLKEQKKGE